MFVSSVLYSQIVVYVSCMLTVYRMLLNFIEIQGQRMSLHRFNSFNKWNVFLSIFILTDPVLNKVQQ